jgi:hypothetical protein
MCVVVVESVYVINLMLCLTIFTLPVPEFKSQSVERLNRATLDPRGDFKPSQHFPPSNNYTTVQSLLPYTVPFLSFLFAALSAREGL